MLVSGLLEAFVNLRPALLRYLILRGASSDEAQDILQDVSLKLAHDKVGPVDQPQAYLYRMATNHFLLHRRTAVRRAGREQEWVHAGSGDSPDIDQQPSVEASIIARQQLVALQRVLDNLPERTQTIFRRFRLDGEPQRQIAADLGISVSAVEKHLAHAYEKITAARLRSDGEDRRSRYLRLGRGQDDF